MPFATTAAMAARNACVAVDDGHPVMSYLCSTCYAINKKAHKVLEVPKHREATNRVLAEIDRAYDDRVAGRHRSPPHPRDPLERARVDAAADPAPA